ncbi:MAG: TonB family protein [Desulfobacterales bacterium]|jgi:TonB family protein
MIESNWQSMVLENGQDFRKVMGMFAISAACHVAFFLLIMIAPNSFSSSYRLSSQPINVDLVSLPAAEPALAPPAAAAQPAPVVTPEPPPTPETVPVPAPKPDPVPIAPKPKPKPQKVVKSLKQKTIQKNKVKKTTVQKPTPPAVKAKSNQVSKAIESMRRKVADQEKTRTLSGTGSPSGGGGGGGGTAVLGRIQNYRIEAAIAVGQNWAFSQQLAGVNEQLETLITFRILPNGEITDIKVVQASGNRYLDESALRAVQKASPVAPHPDGLNRPYIEVGVRATPAGFK